MRLRISRNLPASQASNIIRLWSLPVLILLLAISHESSFGQTDFTRIYGPVDRDVAVPKLTGVFGQVDASALAELVDHIGAVLASGWHDMSGTGKITYMVGETTEVDDATLTILNANSYRLDVARPQGTQSTRSIGEFGVLIATNGSKQFLPPATATQGLFAFPQLRVATFPSSQTSIYDMGMLSVDGKMLHRISVEHPLGAAATPNSSSENAHPPVGVVTDFYLDPVSHLLIKSVASIQLSGLRAQFLQCTTYSDYRKVSGSLVPFRFEQSLNGQIEWVLQLNAVELNTGIQQSSFSN